MMDEREYFYFLIIGILIGNVDKWITQFACTYLQPKIGCNRNKNVIKTMWITQRFLWIILWKSHNLVWKKPQILWKTRLLKVNLENS